MFAHRDTPLVATLRPLTALSWEDRGRMQWQYRKHFRFKSAPEWVFNDDEMRRVISAYTAILARVTFIPQDIRMLRLLNRRAIKLLRKSPSWEHRQLARVAQTRGLPTYLAAILYKTFRIGWDSVQCGADLHVSPLVIRQQIHRIKIMATRLDGDRVRWNHRIPSKKKHIGAQKSYEHVECIELYRQGWKPKRLAERYHVSTNSIDYVVSRSVAAREMTSPYVPAK